MQPNKENSSTLIIKGKTNTQTCNTKVAEKISIVNNQVLKKPCHMANNHILNFKITIYPQIFPKKSFNF
jgi:hypothetical protein